MQKINNYDVYTNGMSKSYQDKLFFLDKIKEDVTGIVDFGCADGALIRYMDTNMSDIKLVGYDIDENMVNLAKSKSNHIFSTNFNECLNSVEAEKSLLNLSSVLHEVYSYSTSGDIELFWERVFDNNFAYIAIRDLCASESINRPSNINDYAKVLQRANKEQLADYESIWGSIRENRNLVHYLLKYRYVENWTREVRENYFPLSLERLLSKVPTDKYEIVYFENYMLPFTANKIKEDFDIDLHDNTHVKLLLKRKE
jgi:ribosomal protein L11 methylase PrmA